MSSLSPDQLTELLGLMPFSEGIGVKLRVPNPAVTGTGLVCGAVHQRRKPPRWRHHVPGGLLGRGLRLPESARGSDDIHDRVEDKLLPWRAVRVRTSNGKATTRGESHHRRSNRRGRRPGSISCSGHPDSGRVATDLISGASWHLGDCLRRQAVECTLAEGHRDPRQWSIDIDEIK